MLAATAALDPEEVERPLARLRRTVSERPASRWGRALRGAGALVAGVLVVLNPALALQIATLLAGAVLIFYGASELLALLHRRAPVREDRPARLGALAVAGIAGLVIAGTSAAFVLVSTDSAEQVRARVAGSSTESCNGAAAVCDLLLNEAVFAGTHNSFSAADSHGWFITNQRRTIERQLADGIRLFLIDPHWGVQDDERKVRADFDAEARDRKRVAGAMPQDVRRAAQRLAGRLGAGDLDRGERDVWLCHNVCELGATRMVDSLREIRAFLERVQDTPLGAQKVSQLSCTRNRGTADSPILTLNQWADLVPPRREANKPFLRRQLILDRAHESEHKRGRPVGLIAVDHYDQRGLIEAVAELNARSTAHPGPPTRRGRTEPDCRSMSSLRDWGLRE